MYQNLITPVMLKHAFLKAHGFPEEMDDMMKLLMEQWMQSIMPLVDAVNKLYAMIEDTNNGCKLFQRFFKEEIAKCQMHPETEKASS